MAKILIIEDEINTRQLLVNMLEMEEHEVYYAEDGAEGLEKIKYLQPDLIVLDLILPELDGFKLLEELKKIKKLNIPVLIISGKNSLEDKVKGLTEGARDYMTKPFSTQELIARLNALLETEEKSKEKLEYERQKTLAQLAVTLKHEINNPLAIILAQGELLYKEEKRLSRKAGKRIESIIENARRIKEVLVQLEKLEKIKSTNYIAGVDMIDISYIER